MNQAAHNKIMPFIWGNADDVLHGRKLRGSHAALRTLAKRRPDILTVKKAASGLSDRFLVEGTSA